MDRVNSSGRVEWLDVLKCIVMYLVVVAHIIPTMERNDIGYYIYSFHMPLFFAISGMTFAIQCSKREFTFISLIKNKAKGLLWPYITLEFITMFIWLYNFRVLDNHDDGIKDLAIGVLYSNEGVYTAPSNAMWFCPTLFLTFIVFHVIRRIAHDKDVLIALISGLFGIAGWIFVEYIFEFSSPWHIIDLPESVMCLTLGWLFMRHYDFCKKSFDTNLKKILLFAVGLLVGFTCAYNNVRISMASNEYGNIFLFLCAVLGFGISCIVLAMWLPPLRLFKFIGRNTIVILAFHAPIFRFMERFNNLTKWMITEHALRTGTAVFIICIPICYIFEKFFPFLIGRGKKKPALAKPSGDGR